MNNFSLHLPEGQEDDSIIYVVLANGAFILACHRFNMFNVPLWYNFFATTQVQH